VERQPILGDHFYPADDKAREARIAELFQAFGEATPEPALAVILPQGSVDTTGAVAAAALARVEVPDVVVVLSAAHAGVAPRGAIATVGAYRLPGARVPVDTRFAEDFAGLGLLQEDAAVHAREHATEAALPLLLARNPRMRIVPVVFGSMPHATAVRIGNALADCVQNHGRDVLIVATTALAAYLPAPRVEALDARCIGAISALDGAGLYEVVNTHPEALDGVGPVAVLLAACRALGRDAATLVQHTVQTPNLDRSGECVGQASFIVR
jgi:AmmeMemoRadiSam system protein B